MKVGTTLPGALAEWVTTSMDPDVAAGQTPSDGHALTNAQEREAWRREAAQGKRFLAMNPRWREWLAEPYTRYAHRRFSDFTNATHINEALASVNCPSDLRATARRMLMENASIRLDAPVMQTHLPERATPAIISHDRYRSDYERRVAAALTRLGIRFGYETVRLAYIDARGRHHVYTPDFTLLDLHQTHVEVKGRQGAGASDRVKMWFALRQNACTLLLWDNSIIEMVEDMQTAAEVVALLTTTRLAALPAAS